MTNSNALTLLLCAWVLWGSYVPQRNLGRSQERYNAWRAYATQETCEIDQETTKLPPGYLRSVCLPDTINPNAK